MSIQTEITRLNTAKTDILNSIKNKGVDTSSVETLSDVSPLIDSISIKEDLDTELASQNNLLNSQETIINSIRTVLQGKIAGGGTDDRWLQVLEGTISEIHSTEMTLLRVYCLYGCGNLTTLDLPNVTRSGSYSCRGCSSLVNVNLPSISTLGSGMFHTCTSLQRIDLPLVTSIGTNMFYGCTNLTTIILRRTSLVSLTNANAFASMPVESGTGYVYVPDNLVASYKSATNWSNYASQIKPLSELGV